MSESTPRSVFVPHRQWLSDGPEHGQGVGAGFLFLMMALAAALRFFALNDQSLWVDEIATWRELRPAAGLVFHTQVLDSIQGPLHMTVLWPLVRTFAAETVLRVPAAVAGVLTVGLFGLASGRWLDQRSARIGTLLLAISPFHIWYSQEARGYSFLLFCVVAMGFLFREMAAHGPTPRKAGLFALASAGAVWSNMSGIFLWGALGLTLLLMVPPRSRRDWGLWGLAFGLGFLLMAPWLLKASGIWAVDRILPGTETGAALRDETTFSLMAVPYSLFTLFFGHSLGPSLRELHQPDRMAVVRSYLPLLAAGALPVGLAVFYGLLRLRRRHLFLLVWVAVPLGLLAVLAVRNIKPWNTRYVMVILPWLLMLTAYGMGQMPRRLGRILTVWLVGLALWSLGGYYWNPAYAREDVRGASAFVAASGEPSSTVLVPVVSSVFDFYYHGPAEVLETFQEPKLINVADGLDFVERRLAGRDTLWLVESRSWYFDPDGVLPLALARRGHLRLARDLPGVRIYYWERISPGNGAMTKTNFYGGREAYLTHIQAVQEGYLQSQSPVYHVLKRSFDIVAGLGGLLLLLPLFPFIVLLIKLETPGPLFFKQKRVGYLGEEFDCYKFRSMAVDAEATKAKLTDLNEATGAAFKIRNDPRITGVGRFLRSSSLDEFPQLLNVLKGEMTIVGPRPQIPSEVADYTPAQALRLLVKPGLTCLWQVSGRSHLDFEEWMELDQAYVRRRGLRFDLWILARTLPAVIERKGAY